MDPILFNAAMEGNTGAGDFLLADYLKRDEENGYQITPKGNTVLHVAARYGQSSFVRQVIENVPALLCCKNKKNETALHIAANKGHKDVVTVLLLDVVLAGGEGINKEELMRMADDNGDTALHKAVRSRHVDVVKILVKEDPEFEFPANNAGETPLYLAAESGSFDCLSEILKSCNRPTYAGPCGRTALHAAIIHEHIDCATSLWEWNNSLCEKSDKWGWNPLHHAVKQGLKEVVSKILGWKKSLAYTQAGSENNWTTSVHIAASEGYVDMINELSFHCPDCLEMLNSSGQNALHVAISNEKRRVVRFLLDSKEYSHDLIDEADKDGNTPLHLLAASNWLYVPKKLSGNLGAKKMLFNKENQTPLDIAVSGTETTRELSLPHCRLGRRDFEIKRMKTQELEDKMESMENKAAQLDVVVAALLMTVTFTAGFTLPGGFESDPNSPNQGMAVLIRKTAFRAFVVCDAIAFTFSALAILLYFSTAKQSRAPQRSIQRLKKFYDIAGVMVLWSMFAVVIAFATGMFATLAHSLGLAVAVCLISCLFFLLLVHINFGIVIYDEFKMKNISW